MPKIGKAVKSNDYWLSMKIDGCFYAYMNNEGDWFHQITDKVFMIFVTQYKAPKVPSLAAGNIITEWRRYG